VIDSLYYTEATFRWLQPARECPGPSLGVKLFRCADRCPDPRARSKLLWRTVPSRGINRDQPGDGQPGGGAVLQQAVKMTRLSCQRFRSHEVWLWLSVIGL